MDIWQHAKKTSITKDRQRIMALGFDQCHVCDEWFHHGQDEWVDCINCGRFCFTCAGEVEWEWCEGCGLLYCQNCFDESGQFYCQVCNSIT